jgi:hypothetical protein
MGGDGTPYAFGSGGRVAMSRHHSLPDLLGLDLNENRDPGRLRSVLSAHFNYQQMRMYRRFLVGLLAILGGAFWVGALWPGGIAEGARSVGIRLFAGCLVVTAVVAALEVKWRRRRARLIGDVEGGRAAGPPRSIEP